MRRHLRENLTLQLKSETSGGLEPDVTWSDVDTYALTVIPASTRTIELSQYLGVSVTHTALAPKGLTVTATDHRFESGSTIYKVVEVTDTPMGVLLNLEVQS